MATIGTLKKTGDEYAGEIITLSVQAKTVRIVPADRRTSDSASTRRVFVSYAIATSRTSSCAPPGPRPWRRCSSPKGTSDRSARSTQAAWRDAPFADQVRRFLGAGARRKLRYAWLLVRALRLDRQPPPLRGALGRA